MEFVFQYLSTRYDLENYSEKKEFTLKVEDEIKQLSDEFDRQNFAHQLEQLTGFHLDLGAAPATKTGQFRCQPGKNGSNSFKSVARW